MYVTLVHFDSKNLIYDKLTDALSGVSSGNNVLRRSTVLFFGVGRGHSGDPNTGLPRLFLLLGLTVVFLGLTVAMLNLVTLHSQT